MTPRSKTGCLVCGTNHHSEDDCPATASEAPEVRGSELRSTDWLGVSVSVNARWKTKKAAPGPSNISSQRKRHPMPDHQPTEAKTQDGRPGSL